MTATVWALEVTGCRCCSDEWAGLISIHATRSAALRALVEWANRQKPHEYVGEVEGFTDLYDRWSAALDSGAFDKYGTNSGPGAYWQAPDWLGLVKSTGTIHCARRHLIAVVRRFKVRP